MAHQLQVGGPPLERAPSTTDAAALADFCRRWELDPRDPRVVAFLDFSRRDDSRWDDWSAAWRTWAREPREPPPDELDTLDLHDLTRVGLAEIGMPVVSAAYGLAPATVARIAGRTVVIAMTLTVAGLRAPGLREKIRAARRAAGGPP
jgi:hypothetical protein